MGRISLPVGSKRAVLKIFRDGRAKPFGAQTLVRTPAGTDEATTKFFEDQAQAEAAVAALNRQYQRQAITIDTAIVMFHDVLVAQGQQREAQIARVAGIEQAQVEKSHYPKNTRNFLHKVFRAHLHRPLVEFTADDADAIFGRLTGLDGQAAEHSIQGKPYAVKSLQSYRFAGYRFFMWARQAKLLPRDARNPFEEVVIPGEANQGKPQLKRHQILNLFLPALSKELQELRPRALFIGMQFYGGCRPAEVRLRTLEEVEPDGSAFKITHGKNKRALRTVPLGPLKGYVAAYVKGKKAGGDQFLFSDARTKHRGLEKPWCRSHAWDIVGDFLREHGIPYVPPYSFRGAEASLRVESAADKSEFTEDFRRGLMKDKGHGDWNTTWEAYVSDDAKGKAQEAQVRQNQRTILEAELSHRLDALHEALFRQALERAQAERLDPIQTAGLMLAAQQEFERRRQELERGGPGSNNP